MAARSRVSRVAAHLVPLASSASAQALQSGATVCVTGASGYVGSWLTKLLLEKGYTVRACVRNTDDDKKAGFLKAMPEYGGKLSLHSADMTVAGSYDAIFAGCTTVFHPAEVFMSFSAGRDMLAAKSDFAAAEKRKPGKGGLHNAAMATSQYIVDSINKSGTVKRLVYTSSVAALAGINFFENPVLDESGLPEPGGPDSYGHTKRLTEKFFDYSAQASGTWDMLTGNPGDIIGPILSPHQAAETWQGKIAGVLRGEPSPQELGGRPWWLVDVRDVAAFEIALAESKVVFPGSRFLLASGDRCPAEELGTRAMYLHAEWDCATTVSPHTGTAEVTKVHPMWMRMSIDNRKARSLTGLRFRTFNDTFKATVDSLVSIGGVQPRLK